MGRSSPVRGGAHSEQDDLLMNLLMNFTVGLFCPLTWIHSTFYPACSMPFLLSAVSTKFAFINHVYLISRNLPSAPNDL
jgi:hypothetical protein